MGRLNGLWWKRVTNAFLILIAALGFGLGFALLSLPADSTPASGNAAPTASPASLSERAASLPRAWDTPSPMALPSVTLTISPTETSTTAPTSVPTTPLPTATPTETPLPTPTPTPIHGPADSDPTWIIAESIDLDAEVIPVGIQEETVDGQVKRVWQVADYAAGFHEGTARPGHVGNTVITGHNNVRGEVFRDIHKLEPGDEIYLWVGDSPYCYQVSASYRLPIKGAPEQVLEDNLRWIQPTEDQRLTLVTCWPYWSNTHRTIVVAFPAPWPDES